MKHSTPLTLATARAHFRAIWLPTLRSNDRASIRLAWSRYIDALHREPTVLQRYDDPVPDFPDTASLYDAQIASDRRLLTLMLEGYGGGPVGLDTLAAGLGEDSSTLEAVVEPYLLQLGFLQRTPRGRLVTPAGRNHLGWPAGAAA